MLNQEPTPGKIFVDANNFAVMLPVFNDKWVPIHISLIKTVVTNTEGNWFNLRLNLCIPGANNIANNMLFPTLDKENPIFLRDLSFKSTDTKFMEKTKKDI
jgi:nucleosome binding factor SPN SPT16 subunit